MPPGRSTRRWLCSAPIGSWVCSMKWLATMKSADASACVAKRLAVVDHVHRRDRLSVELGIVLAQPRLVHAVHVAGSRSGPQRQRCIQRADLETLAAQVAPGERPAAQLQHDGARGVAAYVAVEHRA